MDDEKIYAYWPRGPHRGLQVVHDDEEVAAIRAEQRMQFGAIYFFAKPEDVAVDG